MNKLKKLVIWIKTIILRITEILAIFSCITGLVYVIDVGIIKVITSPETMTWMMNSVILIYIIYRKFGNISLTRKLIIGSVVKAVNRIKKYIND